MSEQVLIISDTHLSNAAGLPTRLLQAAESADPIVHAGDVSCLEVLTVLGQFAPVTAVHGNVELPEVYARLGDVAFATIGGLRFGVLHDAGASTGRHERLAKRLPDCQVRVYGHSHQPEVAQIADQSWVINPGSPTQRRRAPFHSCVWLTIDDSVVDARLVNLDLD